METKLSVTEGSRNFSDLINRIVYRGETAVLTRSGRDVVRLIPVRPTACTGLDLAKKFRERHTPLSDEEAESLAEDLASIREAGNQPSRDPWAE